MYVSGGIGGDSGKRMLTVTQRGRQIFPGAVYRRSYRCQQRAIIVNGYPGTGFRRAVEYGTGVVGKGPARQRSGSRLHVIKSLDNRWCKRGDGINNDVKSSGRGADVSGSVRWLSLSARGYRCQARFLA